jgi:hypothetical protein
LQEVEDLILVGQALLKALQNEDKDIRITNDAPGAWLVADSSLFVVYQQKRRQHHSRELIRTESAVEALRALLDATD